jgi:hypothetical protein
VKGTVQTGSQCSLSVAQDHPPTDFIVPSLFTFFTLRLAHTCCFVVLQGADCGGLAVPSAHMLTLLLLLLLLCPAGWRGW